MEEQLAMSPQQAAQASSLSLRYVMKAIATGDLPSQKIGRRRVILRDDLVRWLQQEKQEG